MKIYNTLDFINPTLNNIFDNLLKIELTDVICENRSLLNGKTTKSSFDQCQKIQEKPVALIIFLQRTMYKWEKNLQK